MKITIKALSIAVLCAVFVLALTPFVHADSVSEFEPTSEYKAKAAYLYSYNASRVLYSKGEELSLAPASSAKMMTGLIVCERYSDKLDEQICISSEMISGISGTSMGLTPGMTVSIRDLLYGTVCGVNNDAATVLAIACAGSTDAFVLQMNDYAALLDMRSTKYSNPTGMDSKNAYTTLLDTVKLAAKAAKNELYLSVSSSTEYVVNDSVTVYNRNALISQFSAQGYLNKNANGLIAGSTDEGGYVLATLVKSNGKSFLCVVMGASADENDIYSYKTANDLLNYGAKNYSERLLGSAGDKVASLEVKLALDNKSTPKVGCVIANDIYAILPDDASMSDVSYEYYLNSNELTAPVEKGTVLGGIDFYYKGKLVAHGDLVSAKSISANSLLAFLDGMKNAFLSPIFILSLIFIALLTLIYFYLRRKTAFRRRINKYSYKKRI